MFGLSVFVGTSTRRSKYCICRLYFNSEVERYVQYKVVCTVERRAIAILGKFRWCAKLIYSSWLSGPMGKGHVCPATANLLSLPNQIAWYMLYAEINDCFCRVYLKLLSCVPEEQVTSVLLLGVKL